MISTAFHFYFHWICSENISLPEQLLDSLWVLFYIIWRTEIHCSIENAKYCLYFFYLPFCNLLNMHFKTFLLLAIKLYSGSSNALFYYCFTFLNKVSIGRRAEKISFLLNFSGSRDWTVSLSLDTTHFDEYWLQEF